MILSVSRQKLIVVSAPSGAGKTTLCARLLRDFPCLTLSVSTTTRSPRGSEKDGIEYFFINQTDFEKAVANGQFAEHALVHGNYYGTSRAVIDQAFKDGKSVLLDIDVQGAESLRRAYPDRTVRVFIAPPSLKVLESRLRARGTEDEESIQRRLKNADLEMKAIQLFDHVVVNEDLEKAYLELHAIVSAELHG